MNQRGSLLLEGILSLCVLLALFLLATGVLVRGFELRLAEHARFVEARKALGR